MERERLEEQEALTHLRRAARSSGRKLNDVAREVVAGQPLPGRSTKPTHAMRQQILKADPSHHPDT
jgi:hypothetical protein